MSVHDVIVVYSMYPLVKIVLVVLAMVAVFDATVLSVVGVKVGAVLHAINVAPAGDDAVSSIVKSSVGVVVRPSVMTIVSGRIFSLGDAGVDVVLTVLREESVDDVIVVCSLGTLRIVLAAPATVAGCDAGVLSVLGIDFGDGLYSIKVAPAGGVVVSSVGNSCVGVVVRFVGVTAVDGLILFVVDANPDVFLRVL